MIKASLFLAVSAFVLVSVFTTELPTESRAYRKCPCKCVYGYKAKIAVRMCKRSIFSYQCQVEKCTVPGTYRKGKWCCDKPMKPTPSSTSSPSAIPSSTSFATPTPTPSVTPSSSPPVTPSSSPSVTPSSSPSVTPSSSPSASPSVTPSVSATPSMSAAPSKVPCPCYCGKRGAARAQCRYRPHCQVIKCPPEENPKLGKYGYYKPKFQCCYKQAYPHHY